MLDEGSAPLVSSSPLLSSSIVSTQTPIVGRLTYCLQLAGASTSASTTTTTHGGRARKSPRDPPADNDNNNNKQAFSLAGWILEAVVSITTADVPQGGNGSSSCNNHTKPPPLYYLLSLSKDALSQLGNSFNNNNNKNPGFSSSLEVIVDQYTAIPLSWPPPPLQVVATTTTTTTSTMHQDQDQENHIRPIMLLEVRSLRLHPDHHDPQPYPPPGSSNNNNNNNDDDVWTLRQVARLEWVDRLLLLQLQCKDAIHNNNNNNNNQPSQQQQQQKKQQQQYYTLQATVSVISPVLTIDPKDPFVLMELREYYSDDPHNNNKHPTTLYHYYYHSCIVVVRGSALGSGMTSLLVPLQDTVLLRQVPKQKWRIPEVLLRQWQKKNASNNNHNVTPPPPPGQVFVVNRPDQLWRIPTTATMISHQHPFTTTTSRSCVAHGRIVSCHYKDQRLHYLELELVHPDNLDSNNNSHHHHNNNVNNRNQWTLFVTYFPMPTSLQLGLRPGAVIRVVHWQSLRVWGGSMAAATAQTHLSIVQFAAAAAPPPLVSASTTTTTAAAPLSMTTTTPAYHWESRPRRSYAELASRHCLARVWPNGRKTCRLAATHRCRQRNAYAEFFHANVNDDDDNNNNNNNEEEEEDAATVWLPLDRLHELALHCMEQRLQQQHHNEMNNNNNNSNNHPTLRVGWMASIHLSAEQLVHQQNGDPVVVVGDGSTSSTLCTAGELSLAAEKCSSSSSDQMATNNGMLSNGTVVLPVIFHCDSSCSSSSAGTAAGQGGNPSLPNQPKSQQQQQSSGPSLVSIHCVVVSCICIATLGTTAACGVGAGSAPPPPLLLPTRIHLPPYHRNSNNNDDDAFAPGVDRGACALVRTHRGVFVVSIFVVGRSSSPLCQSAGGKTRMKTTTVSETAASKHGLDDGLDPECPDEEESRNSNNNNHPSPCTSVTSIADALAGRFVQDSSSRDTAITSSESSSSSSSLLLVGLLARSIFRAFRIKAGGTYSGCTLTLAHAPSSASRIAAEHISVLQSVEIMPPIAMERSHRHGFLQNALSSLVGRNVMEDQISLGLVWWMLASCEQRCALLCGGWDEANDPSSKYRSTAVGILVYFPSSSVIQSEQTRGYTRFRCAMSDMVASVRFFARSPDMAGRTSHGNDLLFDSMGSGQKYMQGMLDRRPSRRQLEQPAHGEILWRPVEAGIPCCTIMSLFAALCRDLRTGGSRCNLCPSLVRRVRGATFLGVSYCRVLAECTKCYSSLRDSSSSTSDNNNTANKMRKKNDGGVVASVPIADLDRETYWHRPLPTNPGQENMIGQAAGQQRLSKLPPPASSTTTTKLRSGRDNTPLQCPNHCPVDQYGAIKWECSGTLDDGTGQARLFAEREASLCLLGLSAETVAAIEQGAWRNDDGIVFSKTMPPKAYLRHAILTARSLAETHHKRHNNFHRKRQRPLQDSDVLVFLTRTARAEYLLQQHCRSWLAPPERDYYVRCKPLVAEGGAAHVKQTDIEVFPGNSDVATYTLPPLKLQLVDCCVDTCDNNNNSSAAAREEEQHFYVTSIE